VDAAFKKGHKKMRKAFMFVLALGLGLASMAAFGQQPTGSIEGTVTDPQGAVVQNATVSVRNTATNATRDATTGSDGHYRVTELLPGHYEVKVSGANFKTSVASDVNVNVGQNLALDVKLEIGGATEQVTIVGGGEAQIDRTDNTVAGVVNTRQIQNLPLNGRNFLDLAQLQPGVERVDGASFDPTKANYTGVSIAGQAGRSTQITVDGGSVVDNIVGTTVQNFSQEIVQEFQLGISNYDLSTGASATGSVNIISRSGSNNFHGNGYLYDRRSRFAAFPALGRLDAANGVAPDAQATKIPFDRQQFGGTFSGPIKKNKLFFFGNVEYNNQDAVAIHILSATLPGFSGFTPNQFNELLVTSKIDWNVSSKTTFFGRYSHDNNDQRAPFPAGTGIRPRSSTSGIFQSDDQLDINRSDGAVFGLNHTFSSNLVNDLRYNYNNFHNRIDAFTKNFPQIRVIEVTGSQTWRSGTNYITPQVTNQIRNQLKDDLTYTRGKHTFRFGGDWEHTSIDGLFDFAKPARIRIFGPASGALTTEADFLNAPVRDLSLGVGSGVLPFNSSGKTINSRWQVYGTDTWKVARRFNLNFGLAYRWDSNLWNHDLGHPAIIAPLFGKGTKPSPRDKNNIAPRAGFAWDVKGNGRTVIRGGFGIYYDTAIDNLRLFERADLGPPGAELFLVGNDIQSALLPGGNGRFGSSPASPSGYITLRDMLALYPSVRAELEARQKSGTCKLTSLECTGAISGPLFSTEFQIPYSLQYAVGIQKELPGKMVLQADFNYRKGLHEVIVFDVNHFDDIVSGPRTAFPNAVPYADSSAFSTYQALLVRLDRRFANGFQFTGSYTFSRFKAFGSDALGLGVTATDLNNLRKEFGPAGLDRTHRLVVSAIWELPYFKKSSSGFKRNLLGGYTVSVISTSFSGVPLSAFLPDFADLSGTGTFQSYLPGTGEGSIGRQIKTVGQLNALITAYNAKFAGTDDPQGTTLSTLALVPPNTPMGGDSLISQDVRLTKTFRFSESMHLDLIGEVFNLFNIANLTGGGNNEVLSVAGTPVSEINTFRPTERTTSVFGTGGPRAFQFAVKFTF
jgi:hypothetical protein